ncbi:MAG: helix-turn-helix transcriptional regulator [Symploca sp. SIO2G7]|nr:helix-turn-helix transcriptional regulator [Symploca sp. SIO2G7]
MPVKNKIKEFVDGLGISVYEFRKRTGIAPRTAYDLYNEEWQLPSSTVLTKICDRFEIQPSVLLEWVSPEERPPKKTRSQLKKNSRKEKVDGAGEQS